MRHSAWLSATAALLFAASIAPALAQPAPAQPARPLVNSLPAPARPVPGVPKSQTGAPKSQRSTQPQRAKPNTSYAYCRGVARYMRLRGAARRKTILDCQLGVMPSVSKG